jgi:hypothetical protein
MDVRGHAADGTATRRDQSAASPRGALSFRATQPLPAARTVTLRVAVEP